LNIDNFVTFIKFTIYQLYVHFGGLNLHKLVKWKHHSVIRHIWFKMNFYI